MEKLEIRLATIHDCDFIFGVVNSELARAMSLNSRKIQYEEHCAWFEKILSSSAIFFIGFINNTPVGYVRFEMQECCEGYVLSVAVTESCRGKNLGSRLVDMCCAEVFRSGIKRVDAFVKPENLASIRLFERCGFRCNGNISYNGHSVVSFSKINE